MNFAGRKSMILVWFLSFQDRLINNDENTKDCIYSSIFHFRYFLFLSQK